MIYPPIVYLPDKTLLSISRLNAERIEFRYHQSSDHGIAAWTIPEITSECGSTYNLIVDDIGSLKRPQALAHSGPSSIKVFAVWATVYTFFNTFPAKKLQSGKPEKDLVLRIKVQNESARANLDVVLASLEATGFLFVPDSSLGSTPTEYFITRQLFWQTQQFPYLPEPADPEQARSSISFRTPFSSAYSDFIYEPKPLHFTHAAVGSHGRRVRHPQRPKPPAPGTAFYNRYVPSVQSFLIFRTASEADLPTLHKWMNTPRVNAFWGEGGPISHQTEFLRKNSELSWSFPVIGYWAKAKFPGPEGDFGVEEEEPFGYFEIYWVKEDRLGEYTDADDWDRGVHVLVGEEKFRGAHRVREWLGGLVHYMFLSDPRTQTVMLEPRIDNTRFHTHLEKAGFYKEKQISFPHKQSFLMKLRREAWEGLGPESEDK